MVGVKRTTIKGMPVLVSKELAAYYAKQPPKSRPKDMQRFDDTPETEPEPEMKPAKARLLSRAETAALETEDEEAVLDGPMPRGPRAARKTPVKVKRGGRGNAKGKAKPKRG